MERRNEGPSSNKSLGSARRARRPSRASTSGWYAWNVVGLSEKRDTVTVSDPGGMNCLWLRVETVRSGMPVCVGT